MGDRLIDDSGAIRLMAALAQPTRLAVFRLLMQAGETGLAAGAIAARLAVPASTLSAHLAILSQAGAVTARRDGRHQIYALDFGRVGAFLDYLVNDCCAGRPDLCGFADLCGFSVPVQAPSSGTTP